MVLELLGTGFAAENARSGGKQNVQGDSETDKGQIESLPKAQLGHVNVLFVLGHFEHKTSSDWAGKGKKLSRNT